MTLDRRLPALLLPLVALLALGGSAGARKRARPARLPSAATPSPRAVKCPGGKELAVLARQEAANAAAQGRQRKEEGFSTVALGAGTIEAPLEDAKAQARLRKPWSVSRDEKGQSVLAGPVERFACKGEAARRPRPVFVIDESGRRLFVEEDAPDHGGTRTFTICACPPRPRACASPRPFDLQSLYSLPPAAEFAGTRKLRYPATKIERVYHPRGNCPTLPLPQ